MLDKIAFEKVYQIPLCQIVSSPNNPRKSFAGEKFNDLVESIRTKGVIEPIIVRPEITGNEGGNFEIVAGERRYRATILISKDPVKDTIPAMVRELTNEEAFDFMLIENLQRENLTPLEEAESFKTYVIVRGLESGVNLVGKVPDEILGD